MRKIAFIFPGQGAQLVGMGKSSYDSSGESKTVFDRAESLLGISIKRLCFEGPEEELTRTEFAQAAIFVTSLAVLAALRAALPYLKPQAACGLSLGEFTALVSLDSISFEDGLRLVSERARLMQRACEEEPGTMASILGLSVTACEEVCKQTGAEVANINSCDQIVVSGRKMDVEKACELAKQKGAKRTILLNVAGAFHSSLMKSAKDGLIAALKKVKIAEPKGVFIPNVTGTPVSAPEEIRSLLAAQLTSPVRWTKTIETLSALEFREALEIGPGRVLQGLAKKIDANFSVQSIDSADDIEALKINTQEAAK